MPTARELIAEGAAACRASPFIETRGDRRAEVESLLQFVVGSPVAADDSVQGSNLARFRRLLARRLAGEPVEYLVGVADFQDMRLQVGPGAFIPRGTSGFLTDVAVARLEHQPTPIVVDVGTGVGPMALSIAARLSSASVYGVDISSRALGFARRNARSLGLLNVRFLRGDLFDPLPRRLRGRVAAIMAHPPYAARWEMPHLRHEMGYEPTEAITDSSKSGLSLVGRIVEEAPTWLAPGGWLLIQIASHRAREVAAMYREAGVRGVRHLRDPGEGDRIVAGQLPDAA
jgi:release factor glutamine methyltransferase